MKAEEIRIGNTLLGYDNKPFNWSLHEFLLLGETDIDEIIKAPIPLSEEWFLKAGFNQIDTYKFQMSGHRNIYSRHIQGYWSVLWDENRDKLLTKLTYVHELQNYWYATEKHDLEFQELTA